MKRSASLIFTSLLALGSLAAEKYRINQVNYDITGITKPYALERNIEIDKKRIFENYDDLHSYIENIKQLFANERNIESTVIYAKYDAIPDEDEVVNVALNIATQDSKHFLMVPYPKYNSNDGLVLKLKSKSKGSRVPRKLVSFAFNFNTRPSFELYLG